LLPATHAHALLADAQLAELLAAYQRMSCEQRELLLFFARELLAR
jgi:hypothetical protein